MEFAISISLVAKTFVFLFLTAIAALMILSPINDRKISKTQWFFFAVVTALLFATVYGFLSFSLVD
jgi:hypothetical protein